MISYWALEFNFPNKTISFGDGMKPFYTPYFFQQVSAGMVTYSPYIMGAPTVGGTFVSAYNFDRSGVIPTADYGWKAVMSGYWGRDAYDSPEAAKAAMPKLDSSSITISNNTVTISYVETGMPVIGVYSKDLSSPDWSEIVPEKGRNLPAGETNSISYPFDGELGFATLAYSGL